MIKIKMYYSKNNKPIGFHVEGHAGFAEYGQDIICASVSVLVINTINSIEQFTEDKYKLSTNEKKGMIDFTITSAMSSESELLIQSLLLGLTEVEKNYENKYIMIK